MARSIDTDPLMVANFALMELSVEYQDITEGNWPYPHKVPLTKATEGNWPYPHKVPLTKASTGDVTITQAVVPTSSDFYVWIFQTLWGRGAPRRHLSIVHLDSGKLASGRQIGLYNCMPVSYTPGSEFDANSAEVSIESLTFNVERIEILVGNPMRVR